MSHFEPGACLSLWPTEECEWSTWDIWRSSDIVERAIYLGLALMLAYTFFVLIRFLRRYYLARHELHDFRRESDTEYLSARQNLVSNLSKGLGTLKGISSTAPFVGLAGTSYGILAGLWFSYSGSLERYYSILFTRIGLALSPTTAGILVAVPATVSYNLLVICIENVSQVEFFGHRSGIGRVSFARFAQTLPLRKKFSSFPPFALVAAPVLSSIVALFMPFHPYRVPTGLPVVLPSFRCQPDVADRIIVLQVTAKRELFINTEPVSWTDVSRRLSDIYKARASREVYLRAEDGASFQTVADAIDTVRGVRDAEFNTSLDIKVFLITPQAEANAQKCIRLIFDRSSRRVVRVSK